ncbi:hypothetical protein C4K37_3426 [Pseudomonas chlororaphis subsp. piscium]|nr:hypothetical protein C4K37_3426 [Pseudomonas chlororaphis subsp. piscium]AZC44361.1 hypothetical protein C4K36_3436 [Pseudomonas chlororaphis subsp. piscium]
MGSLNDCYRGQVGSPPARSYRSMRSCRSGRSTLDCPRCFLPGKKKPRDRMRTRGKNLVGCGQPKELG